MPEEIPDLSGHDMELCRQIGDHRFRTLRLLLHLHRCLESNDQVIPFGNRRYVRTTHDEMSLAAFGDEIGERQFKRVMASLRELRLIEIRKRVHDRDLLYRPAYAAIALLYQALEYDVPAWVEDGMDFEKRIDRVRSRISESGDINTFHIVWENNVLRILADNSPSPSLSENIAASPDQGKFSADFDDVVQRLWEARQPIFEQEQRRRRKKLRSMEIDRIMDLLVPYGEAWTSRTNLGLYLAGPEYTGDEWERILGQLVSDVPIEDFQRHGELQQLFFAAGLGPAGDSATSYSVAFASNAIERSFVTSADYPVLEAILVAILHQLGYPTFDGIRTLSPDNPAWQNHMPWGRLGRDTGRPRKGWEPS